MQGITPDNLQKKLKIFFNYFVGPVLLVWVIFTIYHQVHNQRNIFNTWQGVVASFTGPQWWKFPLVCILMFLNWGLEAAKWKLLVSGLQKISFGKAFKSIFSGQAFAFNTLNGTGEYIGRMFYLDEGNRLRAIALSIVGSLSQIIVTLVMGLFALVYLRFFVLDSEHQLKGLSKFWLNGLMFGLTFGTAVLIIVYFSLSWITALVEKIPFVSKYGFFIRKVEELHWKELTRILGLSFARYLVFVVQYLLLLQFFQVDANWLQLCWVVCVMFLVLAVVPSIALAELGLRGEVSIQLLGLLSTNTVGILFTATGIWFINRAVPALAGSLFILGKKLFKNKE